MKKLFVPLYKEYFLKFKSGEQDCEIRPMGHRGWHSGNVYPTRMMTLSNGYGKYDRIERMIIKTATTANLKSEGIPQWHIEAVEAIYGKRAWWLVAYVESLVRRCPQCKAPRKGTKCWKCKESTFEPCEGWDEPKLPLIDRIRELAYEVGYAIGEHGSKERDLDVIAAPWTDGSVGNLALIKHIAKGINAKVLSIEQKPLGRYAATIQIDGWYKAIDISVCPKI